MADNLAAVIVAIAQVNATLAGNQRPSAASDLALLASNQPGRWKMADSTGANTYGTGDYNSIRRNLSFLDGGQLDAGEFSYGAGIDVPGFENVLSAVTASCPVTAM